MTKMRAFGLVAWACAVLLTAGCGGGSGGKAEPVVLAPRLELTPKSPDATLASGSVQVQMLELRNTGSGSARSVRVEVAAGAHVLHLPLQCEGALATGCKQGVDGTLEIAELPAGGVLTLRQRLRVDTGFSGAVRNDWRVGAISASAPVGLVQRLQAYAVDLAVAVHAPAIDGQSGVLSYEVALKNEGADEARDVAWRLLPAPGMALLDVQCRADGAAVCPATAGERIRVERLPKGGGLALKARYQPRKADSRGLVDVNFLTSEVSASGDGNPANDRASHRQDSVVDSEDTYTVQTLDGDRFDLAYQWSGGLPVRITNDEALDLRIGLVADVMGYLMLGTPKELSDDLLKMGSLQMGPGHGLVGGSINAGNGRRLILGASRFVTSMAELEGVSFNLLGSRTDRDGRPLDSFVRAARFSQGELELCVAVQPTPLSACAASDRQRWAAALVGKELELIGPGGAVQRLLAARTPSGPALIQAGRASPADGSRDFWLVLPVSDASGMGTVDTLAGETTFGSDAGLALSGFSEIGLLEYPHSITLRGDGMPNSYLIHIYGHEYCALGDARFLPTGLPALFAGEITASSWRAPCWRGASYAVLTGQIRAILGAAGGPLMGRWLISVRP